MRVKTRKPLLAIMVGCSMLCLAACRPAPQIQASAAPVTLYFDGKRAFTLEKEFAPSFTYRHSGTSASRRATTWLRNRFTELGWSCSFDEWTIINYSKPVSLRNVVCKLPGHSQREILVVAHHDQAPTTVEGADNDGSGIAVLLHLAELFARERPLKYTLVFVATDGEEYGMLGSRRYVQTHPNTANIIAGLSLDNLGRYYYNGMYMELTGQFRRYGPIWLALAAREAARAAKGVWVPQLRPLLTQISDQAGPISFMDQGPMVAAGIPALGFTANVPGKFSDLHYRLWHDPQDTIAFQSAEALQQSGRVVEACLRQLLAMDTFPQEQGPYLYFAEQGELLQGTPLSAIFLGFVLLFFSGSWLTGRGSSESKLQQWGRALPHFLGFWLPLVAAVLLLYLFVAVGLLEKYALYPATSKDPALLHPRWPTVILFLVGLAVLLGLGRWLVRGFSVPLSAPTPAERKSLALLMIGLAGIYVLSINPFSLVFFVPLLFWFLIGPRCLPGKLIDLLLFSLGGLVVYYLIYDFGFRVLRYDWAFLWFVMNLFSTRTIGFWTTVAIMAIIAAGLSLLVDPPSSTRTSELGH